MFRWIAMLIVLSIIGGSGFAAWKYYQWSQQEIRTLAENNAKLGIAIDTEQKTNQLLIDNQRRFSELNQELTQQLNQAVERRKDLEQLFRKHDLTNLSLNKPGLIERRINDGTRKAFDNIESLTASN